MEVPYKYKMPAEENPAVNQVVFSHSTSSFLIALKRNADKLVFFKKESDSYLFSFKTNKALHVLRLFDEMSFLMFKKYLEKIKKPFYKVGSNGKD